MTTTEHTDVQPSIQPRLRMTEDEFVAWATSDVRAEWVNGEVIPMSPVSFEHSEIVGLLLALMRLHVDKHGLGTVTGSEFTARLSSSRRIPDILFITKPRHSIIQKNHAQGAPDLIVEVVSPDSEDRDWRDKYLEYQADGVLEYWVINPATENAKFYFLRDKAYKEMPIADGILRSNVLAGFWFKVEWLWQNPLPSSYEIAKTIGII